MQESEVTIQKSGVRSQEHTTASVKIVKKIVRGVFSEVRKYLSRSFIVVTGGVPKPPGSVLF